MFHLWEPAVYPYPATREAGVTVLGCPMHYLNFISPHRERMECGQAVISTTHTKISQRAPPVFLPSSSPWPCTVSGLQKTEGNTCLTNAWMKKLSWIWGHLLGPPRSVPVHTSKTRSRVSVKCRQESCYLPHIPRPMFSLYVAAIYPFAQIPAVSTSTLNVTLTESIHWLTNI